MGSTRTGGHAPHSERCLVQAFDEHRSHPAVVVEVVSGDRLAPQTDGVEELAGIRLSVGIYATLQLATAILYLRLPDTVESPAPRPSRPRISPETRRTLLKVSSLFAVDSLAGGFLTTALLAFFFYERFGAPDALGGSPAAGLATRLLEVSAPRRSWARARPGSRT